MLEGGVITSELLKATKMSDENVSPRSLTPTFPTVVATDSDSDDDAPPNYQIWDVESPVTGVVSRKSIVLEVASEKDVCEILRKPGMVNPCAPAFAVSSVMRELSKKGLFATVSSVVDIMKRFLVVSAQFGVCQDELERRITTMNDQAWIDAMWCVGLMCTKHEEFILKCVDCFELGEAVGFVMDECKKNYHECADVTVEMVEDVLYDMVIVKKSEEREELSKLAWEFVLKKPIADLDGGRFKFAYELYTDDHDKACKDFAAELSVDKSQFHRLLMLDRVMSTTLADCNLLVNQMLDLHSRNELPLYDHSLAISKVLQFGPNFAPARSDYFQKDEAEWKIKTRRLYDCLLIAIAVNAAANAFRMDNETTAPERKRKRSSDKPCTRSLRSRSKKLRSGLSYQ